MSQDGVLVCTWNLNNRVGRVPFRLEAAHAAVALGADIIVLNEFYPGKQEDGFRRILHDAGWTQQVMSIDTEAVANRLLIASRLPMQELALKLPEFDTQFPSNVAGGFFPTIGMKLIGIRVPAYHGLTAQLLPKAWDWIEQTAASLRNEPAVMLGDLNTSAKSTRSRARVQFRRILGSGWHRAQPSDGASFFGSNGRRSEIDHILATQACELTDSAYVTAVNGMILAGERDSLSDHAALVCRVRVAKGIPNA